MQRAISLTLNIEPDGELWTVSGFVQLPEHDDSIMLNPVRGATMDYAMRHVRSWIDMLAGECSDDRQAREERDAQRAAKRAPYRTE